MKTNTTISIVISQGPFARISGKEGVDLALVCAAFEQKVNLIFVDEGVFHLVKTQDADAIDDKTHDKQLQALAFYEIEHLYAESQSLRRYSMGHDDLLDAVELRSRDEIRQLCRQSKQTVTF